MNVMGTMKNRIAYTILAALASILAFGLILTTVQSHLTLESLQEEMRENIDLICGEYDQYNFASKEMEAWSDRVRASYLNIIRYALEQDPNLASSKDFMEQIVSITGAQDIMFCDRGGKILASHTGFLRDLSDEMYAPLFETFETNEMEKLEVFPFSTENQELRSMTSSMEEGADTTEEATSQDASQTSGSIWETSEYGRSNAFPILYALAVGNDVACVINDYGLLRMSYEDLIDAWDFVLRNEVIGLNGYAFVWSAESGKILYYPDMALKTKDVSVLGIDADKIQDGKFVEQRVNGEDMYLYPVYLSEQDVWLACAVPIEELTGAKSPTRMLLWLLFAVLAADLAYYAILLLRQKRTVRVSIHPFAHKRPETPKKIKLLIFAVFCTIVVFLSSFYLQTLYLMSVWSKTSSSQVIRIESELKNGQYLQEAFEYMHERTSESLARLAGYYIENHPDEITTETLDTLTSILMLDSLTVTNENGETVTSSAYSMGTTDTSATETDEAPSTEEVDPSASDSATTPSVIAPTDTHSITIPLKNADDVACGYLRAECNHAALLIAQSLMSVTDMLKRFQPGEGGFVFAVDQSTERFTWYPDELLIGKNARDYGLEESVLQDNLCTYIHVNKQTCYAVTGQHENDLIYIAIPADNLLRYRLPVSSSAAVAALILLLVCGLALYTCPDETDEAEGGLVADEDEIRRTETAEHKAFRNLALGAAGIAAIVIAMRFFSGVAGDDVLDYVLSGNWERGLNVFALTASLIVTVEGGLALFLFQKLSELICVMLSVRSRTVIRMICGLVSYAGACLIGYSCLVNFGMDPAALMASAGVISVIIGIGANSLVGDIIAGVFLLAEGNVQVGDMIRVGEFRGIVEDLGIRMTRIYDTVSEDVKFVRNSEVQDVVHLSMHPANVQIDYLIGYDEDLERVEAVFKENLKTMRDRIPEIITEPIYQGVQELGDDGVALRIRVQCHDAYREGVQRAVNRDIYLMLNANGIEVPYPQLTLHDGNAPEEVQAQVASEPTDDVR